jgi:hypothetical protein
VGGQQGLSDHPADIRNPSISNKQGNRECQIRGINLQFNLQGGLGNKVTRDFDYLIRVVVADMSVPKHFIFQTAAKIPGVATIKSSIALKQIQYKAALPPQFQ